MVNIEKDGVIVECHEEHVAQFEAQGWKVTEDNPKPKAAPKPKAKAKK